MDSDNIEVMFKISKEIIFVNKVNKKETPAGRGFLFIEI